jgi:hypothetical protein
MSSPKTNEIDPLLHPVQVAKLLSVSLSWLAKSRLRHWPALHQDRTRRAVRHVGRARIHPQPAAPIDERAVVMPGHRVAEDASRRRRGHLTDDRRRARIVVHRNTSVYIERDEVISSLGTDIAIYSGYILWDVFLN